MKLNLDRLRNLADILDVADAKHRQNGEPTYKQSTIVHPCGTPACAIGHYAAATPDRWNISNGIVYHTTYGAGLFAGARAEFGISSDDWDELFEFNGCGRAKTSKQAASYIRDFIARKEAEFSASGDLK